MIRTSPLLNAVLLLLPRLARFAWRVLRHFIKNRGILLAGGVGYNILLSIVPLFAVLVVLLTHLVDEQHLLGVLEVQARHLAPSHADVLLEAVRGLLDSGDVMGILGFPVLLLFSSFAGRCAGDHLSCARNPAHQTQRLGVRDVALCLYSGAGGGADDANAGGNPGQFTEYPGAGAFRA